MIALAMALCVGCGDSTNGAGEIGGSDSTQAVGGGGQAAQGGASSGSGGAAAQGGSGGVLRLGQGVGVFYGDSKPAGDDLIEKPLIWREHLDAIEILVGGNWKYWQWSTSGTVQERATKQSAALADEVRQWLDALHANSMQGAVSINFQGSLPGVSYEEMTEAGDKLAAYHAYGFDLDTGKRVETEGFDWHNEAARAYALGAFTDVSLLIGPTVDWLFINESSFKANVEWYDAHIFSDASLADFSSFSGSTKGLPIDLNDLPNGVTLAEPELFNTSPSAEDWAQLEAWRRHTYGVQMDVLTKGFAAGQSANPNYRGAIWFQAYTQVDPQSGLLDVVFAVPGVTHGVVEYLLQPAAGNPHWDAWSAAASANGKPLGAFAQMSKLDVGGGQGVSYQPGLSTSKLDELLTMAIGQEQVPIMVMYQADCFDPDPAVSGTAHNPEQIATWDAWTLPKP